MGDDLLDVLAGDPEDNFPSEEELLEGLNPPAPKPTSRDLLIKRLREIEAEIRRRGEEEEWIRRRLEEWMRLQEKLRAAIAAGDSKTIRRLNEKTLGTSDWPHGPNGPEYGPLTRQDWVPYVLPRSPNPFDRNYDLGDEFTTVLSKALVAVVSAVSNAIAPGSTSITSGVAKRLAESIATQIATAIGLDGALRLHSDWLQGWMHLKDVPEGRATCHRNRKRVMKEALRIAQTPAPEAFVAAGFVADSLGFGVTIAGMVSDALSDPIGTAKAHLTTGANANSLRAPSFDDLKDIRRAIEGGMFEHLETNGLRCRPLRRNNGGRVILSYGCRRYVHFVPIAGPIVGGTSPRLPDHLSGNRDFFPVDLLNRLVDRKDVAFVRFQHLQYRAEAEFSFPDSLDSALRTVFEAAPLSLLGAVVDELVSRVGADKVRGWLGL